MAEYIAEYRRKAAYFRELASNTDDAQLIADLHYLAEDCEGEASKLEEAFEVLESERVRRSAQDWVESCHQIGVVRKR